METAVKKLSELTEEKLIDTDCFLVEIQIAGNKVNVFIDSDSFVKIELCAQVSRHLETYLDAEQPLGEKYILEVSSAGMTRPLIHNRQFLKHKGKMLNVLKNNGERVEGMLVENDEEGVSILKEKRKKGKVVEELNITIPFKEIKNIKRVINF